MNNQFIYFYMYIYIYISYVYHMANVADLVRCVSLIGY